jgi:hypothetical protein
MDREERQIHIDMAERFVAEGLAQIEKQRRLIQELEGNGREATRAQAFLATLLESQGTYERHRDRLRQEAGTKPQSQQLSESGPDDSEVVRQAPENAQDDGNRSP